MNFAEIERRTGLNQRRLCYVMEHDFFDTGGGKRKWWRKASLGRGKVRNFTPLEAFMISCVAMMLEAGLKRAVVRDCMARIGASEPDQSKNLLWRAFSSNSIAVLEIGDREHYRIRCEGPFGANRFDTDWCCLATGKKPKNYSPYVVVCVDVAKLRENLKS